MRPARLTKEKKKDIYLCIRFSKEDITKIKRYTSKNAPKMPISSFLRDIVLQSVAGKPV